MKSPRGSPRLMMRPSSPSSSVLLETHPASTSSERSPLLIPPRRRSSISSDHSASSGVKMRRTNSDRSNPDHRSNCLTSSWIWRMVWSRITLLLFVAGSLVLLGVGITNLRYQRVNSIQYKQHQQKHSQSNRNNNTSSTSTSTIHTHSNSTTDSSGSSSTTINSQTTRIRSENSNNNNTKTSINYRSSSFTTTTGPWPPTATEIANLYSTTSSTTPTTTTTTFGELASTMLPIWYQQTMDAIHEFVDVMYYRSSSTWEETETTPSPIPSSSENTNSAPTKDPGNKNVNDKDKETTHDFEWSLYRMRKLVWYTKELLDTFAPLYSTTTTTAAVFDDSINGTKTKNNKHNETFIDILFELQTSLATGYKWSKHLHNNNNNNNNETLKQQQKQQGGGGGGGEETTKSVRLAEQWLTNITDLDRSHHNQIVEFLSTVPPVDNNPNKSTDDPHSVTTTATAATTTTVSSYSSSLYWDDAATPVEGNTEASIALAILGTTQLTRIQKDLQALLTKESENAWDPSKETTTTTTSSSSSSSSKLEPTLQDIIYRLQRQIQVVVDQQDLFQDFFIPFYENPDKTIILLKETKALLDTICDEWKQLVAEFELQTTATKVKDVHAKERHKLKHSLKVQWKGFQWWVQAVDVVDAVQLLLDGLARRIESHDM
ncbi:hypothetical protein IV203_010782 [Nitzschia inconspicua]|uniref:Uncharacterized protein n=1 Tax=Nitzschia inconspicua TaxID=303405 RepID=A0A9K3KWW1_9STRA|nr:hypothetical protein IV203_010782 [Nitzschia inconspicua]